MLIINLKSGAEETCRNILKTLPKWFGLQNATEEYILHASNAPVLVATIDNEEIGFLSLKRTSPIAYEIHSMGVVPDQHRCGIGRALVEKSIEYIKLNKAKYITVKTLSASSPDINYAKTREFYYAIGFEELEELPTLWGANTPCILMIKNCYLNR